MRENNDVLLRYSLSKNCIKKIWISQFLPSAEPDNDTWLWDKSFAVNATNQFYLSSAFAWRKILNRGDSKVEAICWTDLRKRSDLYLCCLLICFVCLIFVRQCAPWKTVTMPDRLSCGNCWQLLPLNQEFKFWNWIKFFFTWLKSLNKILRRTPASTSKASNSLSQGPWLPEQF